MREGVRGVTKARRWDALLLSIVFYVVMAAPIVLSADTVTVSQRDRTFFPDSLQLAPGSDPPNHNWRSGNWSWRPSLRLRSAKPPGENGSKSDLRS